MLYSIEVVMAQNNARLEEAATWRLRHRAKVTRSRRRADVVVLQVQPIAAR